jgi:hypothetical protein
MKETAVVDNSAKFMEDYAKKKKAEGKEVVVPAPEVKTQEASTSEAKAEGTKTDTKVEVTESETSHGTINIGGKEFKVSGDSPSTETTAGKEVKGTAPEVTDAEKVSKAEVLKSLAKEGLTEDEVLQMYGPNWYKTRFDKLTAEREDAKRKEKETADKLLYYENLVREGKLQAPTTTSTTVTNLADPNLAAPKLEQFESLEKYNEAYFEYRERLKAQQTQKEEAQRKTQQEVQDLTSKFNGRENAFMARTSDYRDVAYRQDLDYSRNPNVLAFILRSEQGPEIAYFFGQNKEALDAINTMHPMDTIKELTKIEQAVKTPVTKTKTTAPKPIKTQFDASSADRPEKDLANMSPQEQLEFLRQQDRERRKARQNRR